MSTKTFSALTNLRHMDCQLNAWEDDLIALYLDVCDQFTEGLHAEVTRFSNNHRALERTISDEEVMTLYLFATQRTRRTVRQVYDYAADHLRAWFPRLPSYPAFVVRLNRLGQAFAALAEALLRRAARPGQAAAEVIHLIDSMPIILARSRRCDQASVAPELARKGYCASKGFFFHGLKLHLVAWRCPGHLPVPEYVVAASAHEHDLNVAYGLLPHLQGGLLLGDKIYQDRTLQAYLARTQALQLLTPERGRRGRQVTLLEQALSQRVSRLRQPIESFFNWLQEKTGIECASKVRSTDGLVRHVYGKLAAALYLLKSNP